MQNKNQHDKSALGSQLQSIAIAVLFILCLLVVLVALIAVVRTAIGVGDMLNTASNVAGAAVAATKG